METRISYCPYCGDDLEETTDTPDPRSASGYRCTGCDSVLEMRVSRYPLA